MRSNNFLLNLFSGDSNLKGTRLILLCPESVSQKLNALFQISQSKNTQAKGRKNSLFDTKEDPRLKKYFYHFFGRFQFSSETFS